MTAPLWFLAGLTLGAVAGVAARIASSRHRRTTPPTPAAPTPASDRGRLVARAAATEVATLASGIEGRAHELVEAAASRIGVPRAAEDLLAVVRRLRSLHARLGALGGVDAPVAAAGTTSVPRLVARLAAELQRTQVGLELDWEPPDHLPELQAPHDIAFEALASACRALLRAEHGANRLTLAAEACYAGTTPQVQLECMVEWHGDGGAGSTDLLADPSLALDRDAARLLVAAHGGDVDFQQLRGRSARALLRWPAAAADAAAALPKVLPAIAPAPREHRFGGALLLESDPAVRAMLAAELKATGRAVFVCADASAAATFLRATPERFELLIVDRNNRLADRGLAGAIREVAPALDLLALDDAEQEVDARWPRLQRLHKPFGVHELRRALASVLQPG